MMRNYGSFSEMAEATCAADPSALSNVLNNPLSKQVVVPDREIGEGDLFSQSNTLDVLLRSQSSGDTTSKNFIKHKQIAEDNWISLAENVKRGEEDLKQALLAAESTHREGKVEDLKRQEQNYAKLKNEIKEKCAELGMRCPDL